MGGPGAGALPLDHSCVDGGAGVAGLAAWMRFGQACAGLTEALGASVPCAVPPAVSHAAAGGGAGGALDDSCIDGSPPPPPPAAGQGARVASGRGAGAPGHTTQTLPRSDLREGRGVSD